MRLARGGGIFIAVALGLFASTFIIWWTSAASLYAWLVLGASFLLLCILWFFRDPQRVPPPDLSPEVAVAPADGRVVEARNGSGEPFLAIYMRLYNVHVTRLPLACKITRVRTVKGKHHCAGSPAASVNTRVITEHATPWGNMIISQVAGLLARRIVLYLAHGEQGKRGKRLGLIRFGSRVEVVLPPGYRLTVSPGTSVRAGVTPVAEPAVDSDPLEVP